MNTLKQVVNIELTETSLILSPTFQPYKYALIFLHGIGMNVQKFFDVFLCKEMIGLLNDFKIIIPQAPLRPIAMLGGKEGFSWYNPKKPETLTEDTSNRIIDIIEQEIKHLNNDPKRVFLGGFSQGCIVSVHVRNQLKYPLGGTVLIGGLKSDITQISEESDFTETLIVHGLKDDTVKWEDSKKIFADILKKKGVELKLYDDMEHNLYSLEMRKYVYEFIRARAKIADL